MKYFKYILTLLTAIVFVATAWSQQERQEMPDRNAMGKFAIKKVDFDHIHEVISNPKNTYYYPKLMKAYNSNDTTLSIEAWRNFYYGYTFQEDYNPFRESVYSNVVEQLYYKQPHSRAECDSIEKYADRSLNDNMFDLNQMNFFIYVLKEPLVALCVKHFEMFLKIIQHTIPFQHIRRPQHRRPYMKTHNFESHRRSSRKRCSANRNPQS